MKKRTIVRIVSFAFAVSVLGFGFFIKEKQKSDRYRLMVENDYIRSLNSLNSSVDGITETLSKAVYVKNGTDLLSLSTKLYAEGELAKEQLSNLPNGDKNSGNLYKFLSQVGNYAMSLSKSAVADEEIKDEDSEKLLGLLDTAKKVSNAVKTANMSYDNLEDFSKLIEEKLKKTVDTETLATSLDNLEEDMSDYPTLIYDGPFSDHILTKEPAMLKDQKTFGKKECKDKAEKTFGLKENSLEFDGNESGKIECYRFKNDNITVSVSKLGGFIVYMRKNRMITESRISNSSAVEYAKEFMRGIGVENMVENYYYADEGVCVINFNYLDGQTFCYTDLIKVGVALDTGEIMLFEAKGYINNHTERAFETPKFSEEEASGRVSKLLNIKSSSIALIPTDAGGEVRCYEFLCVANDGQEVLVYIDLKTLDTKDILILTKSDAGTLVK